MVGSDEEHKLTGIHHSSETAVYWLLCVNAVTVSRAVIQIFIPLIATQPS